MRARAAILVLLLSLGANPARAQAGWGLAADRHGDLYFCDIQRDRVWKLGRGGKLRLLLRQNHCHTLLSGYDGNIYGEDVGGESRGEGPLSLWKLTPQGERSYVLPPTTRPDQSIWIISDPAGNSYAWNGNPELKRESQILKRTPDGVVAVLAGTDWGYADGRSGEAKFGNVAGMAIGLDGTLYVAEEGNLRKVLPDGSAKTLERALFSKVAGGLPGHSGLFNHSVGVAVDAQNNVYVVDYGNRRVIQRAPDGAVTTLWQSKGIANALTHSQWGWRPTGIAIVDNGAYVLEDWPLPTFAAELIGSPCVRRVLRDGSVHRVVCVASNVTRALSGAVLVGTVLLVALWRRRRRRY